VRCEAFGPFEAISKPRRRHFRRVAVKTFLLARARRPVAPFLLEFQNGKAGGRVGFPLSSLSAPLSDEAGFRARMRALQVLSEASTSAPYSIFAEVPDRLLRPLGRALAPRASSEQESRR
jgi:hypothetical protein